MYNITSKKGFTLVEIMIVVGIIAVLAGIFLVGSGRFRSAANVARVKADLQKLEALQEIYYTTHSNYAPDYSSLGPAGQLPQSPVTGVAYTTDAVRSCATGLTGKLDDLDNDTTNGNTAGDGQYCLTR